MATSASPVEVTDSEYIEVQDGASATEGSVHFVSGSTNIRFRQDTALPASDAPGMFEIGPGTNVKTDEVYFGLGTEKLYAICVRGSAFFTNTPAA